MTERDHNPNGEPLPATGGPSGTHPTTDRSRQSSAEVPPRFEISPEPNVVLIGKNLWRISDPVRMVYRFNGDEQDPLTISVPAGFRTDFATVPRCLWWLFPPQGEYNRAAIIHDYLCVHPEFDRTLADELFRVVLTEIGVKWWVRVCLYRAVRTYGLAKAWLSFGSRKGGAE